MSLKRFWRKRRKAQGEWDRKMIGRERERSYRGRHRQAGNWSSCTQTLSYTFGPPFPPGPADFSEPRIWPVFRIRTGFLGDNCLLLFLSVFMHFFSSSGSGDFPLPRCFQHLHVPSHHLLTWSPTKRPVQVLTAPQPIPVNITLFGNRVFVNVIKFRSGVAWVLSLVPDAFLRERRGRFGNKGIEETQGWAPCEDGGRDRTDASTCQGRPRIAGSWLPGPGKWHRSFSRAIRCSVTWCTPWSWTSRL